MNANIVAGLVALDAARAPSACRFDEGLPFGSHAVVLPSAFNPPTLAHQHLLERAVSSPSPASVARRERGPGGEGHARQPAPIALLTTRNVDKGLYGATLADRVGMLLALRSEWPALAVVASNQARIIDQAESLTAAFGFETLTFVVGFDTLERLFAPRYYTNMERELAPFFERHRVLAANRGNVSAERVADWIAGNAGSFADRVSALEIDEFPATLSSTQVRDALSEADDHPALSRAVRQYIREHGLYGSSKTK